eukprot:TRINITY_DN1329_c0_g1_i3.p1 TRINITY_DN1329_c0_g1~~TRINITY_DN1329_c0_g1_i3.p1  ORF type:complete len:149 (-),score=11.90 TRINITY_DN1329_c0_g1_i3:188-634(-)
MAVNDQMGMVMRGSAPFYGRIGHVNEEEQHQHLAWKTPALYMFSGVAGMLVLVGLASMVLLFFWWRLAASQNNNNASLRQDGENPKELKKESVSTEMTECEDKVLVIMPGNKNPTFVAKQLSPPSSPSLAHNNRTLAAEQTTAPSSPS